MRLTRLDEPAGGTTLLVEGDIDLAVADQLRDAGCNALLADHIDTLYINLSGVTFMDSSGLNALITIRNFASVPVVLVALPKKVIRLLQVTSLDQAFVIAADDVPPAP
jgi:anti-sigma B factor antagonist